MRRAWEPFLRAMIRYLCGEHSLNSPVFSDLTCTNWGIWMYLSGFTGFDVEMLPRLHKCCSMIRCFGLQKQSYAILPDYLRVLAGSPGYSVPHVSLRGQSPFTCRVRFSIPGVFFWHLFFWRLIHHDLTSWTATEERNTLSLMAPQAEQMQIVVASSCYCFASVGMLLFNKFAVQDFPLDSWATGGCGQCGHQT